MNKNEFVTRLQGKSVREFAARLNTGTWKIEAESLNRYRVFETRETVYSPVCVIDRRSFVLLDKELYRLQAQENPLAACIEIALNNNALQFCIRKASIDTLSAKLIARTFSQAKVTLANVSTYRDNYIIKLSLVESVSERALTDKEKDIADMFKNAQEVNLDHEPPALTEPKESETVNTTATVIPAK